MWPGWQRLERAFLMADLPNEVFPLSLATVQMLFGADVQWDRFQKALDAEPNATPIAGAWMVDAHFFLVAVDNARDRLTAWAEAVDDDEARRLAARLINDDVKAFRHHQEHLEERMPGGKNEQLAKLSAPGNAMIRIEGSGSAIAMNNLRERRFLSFGGGEVDLAAARATVIEVASDLLRWLQARSRFPIDESTEPPTAGDTVTS
jgi:hypothetical protein